MKTASVAVAALGAALLVFPGWCFAGDLEVTVVAADGKKFSGVVYAGDQALEVEGTEAKVTVRNLENKPLGVAADLKVAQGLFKPALRYLGVAEGSPSNRPGAAVTVTAQPVTDIEAFCSGCHPSAKDPVQEGKIVRDVHVSGKELTERYLAQTEKFKGYIERVRREGKTRPPEPIILEERVVKVNGKDVKKMFYTCESCHTVHWKTPWTKYARAAFRDKGTLCAGCHH